MSVIKSQLETDGVYDGKKQIDITAYVNRTSMVSEEEVTAEYYLDDLIKWGNYGFSYEKRFMERKVILPSISVWGKARWRWKFPAILPWGLCTASELTRQAIKYSAQVADKERTP